MAMDDAVSGSGVQVDYQSTAALDHLISGAGVQVDYQSTAALDHLVSLSGIMVDYTPVVGPPVTMVQGPRWWIMGD